MLNNIFAGIISAVLPFSFFVQPLDASVNQMPLTKVTVYVIDGGHTPNKYYTPSVIKDFTNDKGTSLEGKDCDRSWGSFHGNAVSSLVAKYAGQTPLNFVTLKALPCDGNFDNSFWSVYDALNYVADNHKKGTPAVVQMSISTSRFTVLMERPLSKLEKKNIPVIVSAGNYGEDGCNYYSVKSKRTIAVGAMNKDFTGLWENTNTGSCVNYYAESYHSCSIEGRISRPCNSTSFASPLVSAIVASYLAKKPKANIADVRRMLATTSKLKTVKHKGKRMLVRYLPTPVNK